MQLIHADHFSFLLKSKETDIALDPKKALFNKKHCSTRNVIERAFGVLKNRWRCLLDTLELDLKNIPSIIAACFVLHNICIDLREKKKQKLPKNQILTYVKFCG